MYLCYHCRENIDEVDEIPNHQCFKGKNVYLNDNEELFTTNESVEIETNESKLI